MEVAGKMHQNFTDILPKKHNQAQFLGRKVLRRSLEARRL
jgi:hypothetical protein